MHGTRVGAVSARLFHAGRGQVLAGTAVQVSGCWKGWFRGLGRGGGRPGSGAARRGRGSWQSAGVGAALARREASRPHTAGRRGNSWDSSRGAALPFPRLGHPQHAGRVRGARQRSASSFPALPGNPPPNPTINALATPRQRLGAQRHRVFCSCRLPRPARPPASWSLAQALRIHRAPGKAG